MLFDPDDTGVVIAEGRCGLRFRRGGEADGAGVPALIEVRAGPFSGCADECLFGLQNFVSQLQAVHESLSGKAELGGEDGFTLTMTGNGMGGVTASARVFGRHAPEIRLTFEFALDQTFLPAIIEAFRREFLLATGAGGDVI